MTDNEKWINEQLNLIIDDSDKILFLEMSGCFLSGHLRAAYIMSWISIIESLKKKIKSFADLGDSQATEGFTKIEKLEGDKKSTDRLIFMESRKCGILSETDLSIISFLWDQRCLFAHPYNQSPEEDEVKHIIGQSIKLVLGKELLYNKNFLIELCNNIADKPFFMHSDIERIRLFSQQKISRTPLDLHPFLFKTLLYKLSLVLQQEEGVTQIRKLRYFIIELFTATTLNLEDDQWSLEDRVTKYPYECFIGFVHKYSWNKMPLRIKEMLVSFLIIEQDEAKLNNLKTIANHLIEAECLEAEFETLYFGKLDRIVFEYAINFYGKKDIKFDRIKKELSTWNYDLQNPVIDFLKEGVGLNLLNSFSPDHQFLLGRLLKSSAFGGHWKTQNFISKIINDSLVVSENLKAGIAFGSIISWLDKFYLDRDFLPRSIDLLNGIEDELRNSTYEKIIEFIDEYSPDEHDLYVNSETGIIELTSNITSHVTNWKTNSKVSFQLVMDKIKAKYIKQ